METKPAIAAEVAQTRRERMSQSKKGTIVIN